MQKSKMTKNPPAKEASLGAQAFLLSALGSLAEKDKDHSLDRHVKRRQKGK